VLTCRAGFGDRILRNNTTIVLNLDVQVVVRHNAFAKLKDFTKAIGSQSMVGVFPDVSLQQDRIAAAERTATIDEFLRYVSNFRYVRVSGNEIALRQDEPRKSSGMSLNS
jgi:hypothetical protein